MVLQGQTRDPLGADEVGMLSWRKSNYSRALVTALSGTGQRSEGMPRLLSRQLAGQREALAYSSPSRRGAEAAVHLHYSGHLIDRTSGADDTIWQILVRRNQTLSAHTRSNSIYLVDISPFGYHTKTDKSEVAHSTKDQLRGGGEVNTLVKKCWATLLFYYFLSDSGNAEAKLKGESRDGHTYTET